MAKHQPRDLFLKFATGDSVHVTESVHTAHSDPAPVMPAVLLT